MKALISFRRSVVPHITKDQARQLGNELNVDWHKVSVKTLAQGMNIELEHEATLRSLGVKESDMLKASARIALDHISEDPNYYVKLKKIEGK